jgi:hypothetical protein
MQSLYTQSWEQFKYLGTLKKKKILSQRNYEQSQFRGFFLSFHPEIFFFPPSLLAQNTKINKIQRITICLFILWSLRLREENRLMVFENRC